MAELTRDEIEALRVVFNSAAGFMPDKDEYRDQRNTLCDMALRSLTSPPAPAEQQPGNVAGASVGELPKMETKAMEPIRNPAPDAAAPAVPSPSEWVTISSGGGARTREVDWLAMALLSELDAVKDAPWLMGALGVSNAMARLQQALSSPTNNAGAGIREAVRAGDSSPPVAQRNAAHPAPLSALSSLPTTSERDAEYVRVPREPTEEMIEAAMPKAFIGHPEASAESKFRWFRSHRLALIEHYKAMLSSAPGQPEGKE